MATRGEKVASACLRLSSVTNKKKKKNEKRGKKIHPPSSRGQ